MSLWTTITCVTSELRGTGAQSHLGAQSRLRDNFMMGCILFRSFLFDNKITMSQCRSVVDMYHPQLYAYKRLLLSSSGQAFILQVKESCRARSCIAQQAQYTLAQGSQHSHGPMDFTFQRVLRVPHPRPPPVEQKVPQYLSNAFLTHVSRSYSLAKLPKSIALHSATENRQFPQAKLFCRYQEKLRHRCEHHCWATSVFPN